jgi:hypothetical protein
MIRLTFTGVVLAAGLAAGGATARAGVTIVTQHGSGGATTITLEGDHVRIDHPERTERNSAIVLDAAAKKVVMINDQEKSYTEMTEADRQKLHTQMEAMRAQMKDRLKDLPPEQRQKVEQMMGKPDEGGAAPKGPTVKFEAMGSKKTINGFACEMYRKLEDGKLREELCAAPWSAGLVQKSDFAAIGKFAAGMMNELGGPRARNRRNPLAELDQYPGIPISRVAIDEDGKRGQEDQIKSIKRGAIPAARFEVPAGYTKRELTFGPGRGPGRERDHGSQP